MKLNSQYIHMTLELLDEEKIKDYNILIRDIEAVDKGDLQLFVLLLWEAFQQGKEDYAHLNEVLHELDEKYNSLCDRLEYEEGWDPRTQD